MATMDNDLAAALAEPVELAAELKAITSEVSAHDAAREIELASQRQAVEHLRTQVHEARGQLAAASDVVKSLESMLVQERKVHTSGTQAVANHAIAHNVLSDPPMVAPEVCQQQAASIAALHAKLRTATARANRKKELLAESEAEGVRLAKLLRIACEARPEFAQLTHDASIRSAQTHITRKLGEIHETKCELSMLQAQLAQSSEKENIRLPVSTQRLSDLKATLAHLEVESTSRADDVQVLRTKAAEGLRKAVEAETRLMDLEARLGCDVGQQLAPTSPQQLKTTGCDVGQQLAPTSPQQLKTTGSPGAIIRSPELANTTANVNVSAVSRRLSFSPFDLSRDFMPDVESPVMDMTCSSEMAGLSRQPFSGSDTIVSDTLAKPALATSEVGQFVASSFATVAPVTHEAPKQNSGDAQRRKLLSLLANARKQFTGES